MTYPPAPWHMHGSMWLSVFHLPRAADERHPRGVYAVALVDYTEPSLLTYHELLVARPVTASSGHRAVSITDIWVDSPDSLAGGRALWAIPKELCSFDGAGSYRGPLATSRWEAYDDRDLIATARFRDVSRWAPRLPMKGFVEQPGIAEHPSVAHVTMAGSARMLPALGSWTFAERGPLGFLVGARKLASFRSVDFRLDFD